MIYHVGDNFLLGDVECKVAYVNQGLAWLVPAEGSTHIVIARLDEKGVSQNGTKAIPIHNEECLAV